jgi:hypothetical protein
MQSHEAVMMIWRDSVVQMGGVTEKHDRAVDNPKIARLARAVGVGQNIRNECPHYFHTSIFDAFSFPDNDRFG